MQAFNAISLIVFCDHFKFFIDGAILILFPNLCYFLLGEDKHLDWSNTLDRYLSFMLE